MNFVYVLDVRQLKSSGMYDYWYHIMPEERRKKRMHSDLKKTGFCRWEQAS